MTEKISIDTQRDRAAKFPRQFKTVLTLGFTLATQFTFAEGIATDGTMGAAQTLTGANVTIPQTLGTTVGNNLFHSFADFNINTGQTATFTGGENLQNVISRVTGGSVSNIDGVLKSDIKNADFYFINPNGITFGANASVDVPAAFHFSTADKMDFGKNGGVFYADLTKDSKLSGDAPVAFGFLGTSKANNGLIDFAGAKKISVGTGQPLDVVTGQITVENNAIVSQKGNEIRLVAMQGEGSVDLKKTVDDTLPLPNSIPSPTNAGKIAMSDSQITTAANGGQRIGMWGDDISLKNTWIASRNDGVTNAPIAKGVEVHANSLTLLNSSSIWTDSTSSGKSNNVYITTTGTINLSDASTIESDSYGTGETGDVTVESTGTLDIFNGAAISNNGAGLGNDGNVNVKASEINIDGNKDGSGARLTGIYSLYAGNVTVESAGLLNLFDGAVIRSSAGTSSDAGDVFVKADSILLDGKGSTKSTKIGSTSIDSSHNTGNVSVESAGLLSIVNGAEISNATYYGLGNSGNISVKTSSLKIDAQNNKNGFTGIYSTPAIGKAGSIDVESIGAIDIRNGGVIYNATSGDSDAGGVTVKAGTLKIEGTDNTNNGLTGIYAISTSGGKSGTVDVTSQGDLSILHGGVIDSSAFFGSTGKAGDVTVKADVLKIDGWRLRLGSPEPSGIYSKAEISSGGQTGNVNVTASNLVNLSNLGKISIENSGTPTDTSKIAPGTITVDAPNINITTKSQITSQSTGNVAAGNIAVNFANRLNMNSSFITTEANIGDGGAIKINGGDLIYLKDSGFKTTVSGENGNGGDISAKAQMLVMDTGLIQANAKSGNGGNINLALQALIPSADTLIKGGKSVDWNTSPSTINVIQAASQTGVSGTVTNSAPQLNLSGVLANVDNSNFDNNLISQDYCALGQGSSLARKGKGGLPLRAKDFQVY